MFNNILILNLAIKRHFIILELCCWDMKATWVSWQGSLTAFPTSGVRKKSTLQGTVSWKPEGLSRGRVLGEGLTAPIYQLGGLGECCKVPPVPWPPRALVHFGFSMWALLQSCYAKLCAVLKVEKKKCLCPNFDPLRAPFPSSPFLLLSIDSS